MSIIVTEIVTDAEGIDDLELELLTAVYTAPSACLERGQLCFADFECCSVVCNFNGPIGACG